MRRETLSPGQWGALLWAAALAPCTELLPGVALELAGRGAWLSPLAGLLILLPLLWLSRGGDGEQLRGSWPGRGILAVGVGWMWLLTALRLALCARRLVWSGERDGAVWYFLLTLAALALWMTQGKLSALGRAGQLYLVVLLGAAGLVLGLSALRVRPDRVLPLWTGDIAPILLSGVPTGGSLLWGLLPLLLLPGQRERGRREALWVAGGAALLTAAQFVIIGNLGVRLAGESDSAFFALTKSVGVEGAFQRVESVVAAVWILSDLTLCLLLTRAIGSAGRGLWPGLTQESVSSFALLSAAGAALWMLRWGAGVENWNRDWLWMGNLGVSFVVSGGIFLGKKTKSGDILWRKREKQGQILGVKRGGIKRGKK